MLVADTGSPGSRRGLGSGSSVTKWGAGTLLPGRKVNRNRKEVLLCSAASRGVSTHPTRAQPPLLSGGPNCWTFDSGLGGLTGHRLAGWYRGECRLQGRGSGCGTSDNGELRTPSQSWAARALREEGNTIWTDSTRNLPARGAAPPTLISQPEGARLAAPDTPSRSWRRSPSLCPACPAATWSSPHPRCADWVLLGWRPEAILEGKEPQTGRCVSLGGW